MSEQRFDRLEAEMGYIRKDMSDVKQVVVTLAKIEEKHVAVQQRLDNHDSRLNNHSKAIDEQAIDIAKMSKVSGTNEWFVRLLIAAMVGTVAYLLRG